MHIRFVRGQIRNDIASLIDQNHIIDVQSFTASFLAGKDKIDGPDADFYRSVTFEFLKAEVKTLVAKWDVKPKNREQDDLFDGYTHLQKAYPVERGGRRLLVPTPMLTAAEWDHKEAELLSMSDGCLAHRREIQRYRKANAMEAAE